LRAESVGGLYYTRREAKLIQLRQSVEAQRAKECPFKPTFADDRGQREKAKR
jgi:hypothetical protein